jgi:hypothetical protein
MDSSRLILIAPKSVFFDILANASKYVINFDTSQPHVEIDDTSPRYVEIVCLFRRNHPIWRPFRHILRTCRYLRPFSTRLRHRLSPLPRQSERAGMTGRWLLRASARNSFRKEAWREAFRRFCVGAQLSGVPAFPIRFLLAPFLPCLPGESPLLCALCVSALRRFIPNVPPQKGCFERSGAHDADRTSFEDRKPQPIRVIRAIRGQRTPLTRSPALPLRPRHHSPSRPCQAIFAAFRRAHKSLPREPGKNHR